MKMKKSIIFVVFLIVFAAGIISCGDSSPQGADLNILDPQPDAPNTYLPSVMIGGTLYLLSPGKNSVAQPDEIDYMGAITSVVPLSQRPAENGQANIDVEGAPYAGHENGVIVLWDGEWVLFIPEFDFIAE